MTKKDLNHGNVVVLRNGVKCFCYKIVVTKFVFLEKPRGIYFDYYNEDLTYNKVGFEDYDVMKVYKDYTLKELIWERKEKQKPKLTEDEKVFLRNIDKKYKWITRDACGELWVYQIKPVKQKYEEIWDYYVEIDGDELWCEHLSLFNHLFQFIKWEDEEPYLIEELLKGEEK